MKLAPTRGTKHLLGTNTFSITYCNSFEFNHRGRPSCHTFRTQYAVQAPIIITAMCLNTQSKLTVRSSGKLCPNALKKLKLMQNVWVMYWRDLGVIRPQYSLSAILNYAYAELDLDKRNPFSRLFIKGEGEDSHKRGTFTNNQLKWGYAKALASGSQITLLMPL